MTLRLRAWWAAGALTLAGAAPNNGAVEAEASRLCQQLHTLPEQRRAQCCQTPPGLVLTEVCTRTLAAALREGSVAINASQLDACTQALARAYAGCEWVGPFGPDFPKECRSLLEGQRTAGQSCHSSLECRRGLTCAGAGANDAGHCSATAPKGVACGLSVDTLAAYLREDAELAHPPCEGFCGRHLCESQVALGGPCASSAACGLGNRCQAGRCVPGLASNAEPCSGGDCTGGLRCVRGLCQSPRPTGAACTSDLDCRGGCVLQDGEKRCARRCDVR